MKRLRHFIDRTPPVQGWAAFVRAERSPRLSSYGSRGVGINQTMNAWVPGAGSA